MDQARFLEACRWALSGEGAPQGIGTLGEKALHRATDKFISRFAAMESLAGRDLASLNAAEWRALWQRAKTLTCSE